MQGQRVFLSDLAEAMRKDEVLKELGLEKFPAPRVPMPEEQKGIKASIKWRQALDLVDALETAAFHEFLDPSIVLDQELNATQWADNACFGAAIPWQREIPSNFRVFRSTGIGNTPHAKNLYMWLASVVKAQWDMMNCRAMAPPLVFRTNGADGTEPLLGCLMKFDLRRKEGERPAGWALLGEKPKPEPVPAELSINVEPHMVSSLVGENYEPN